MKRIVVALLFAFASYAGAANAYQINATGSNPLTFAVGSTSSTVAEKMRITSAGLIGIGTSTPTVAFEVAGTASVTTINAITISATNFVGNGSGLTGISAGGNLSETIAINDLSDAIVSTTGYNIFLGAGVGALSTGGTNVGIGAAAMSSNTTGYNNVGLGSYAMYYNTTGNGNVAVGSAALVMNSTGKNNTAVGASALYNNGLNNSTAGEDNTAVGQIAMYNNVSGTKNVAIGSNAMSQNKSGSQNHAIGYYALNSNIAGSDNIAIGTYALRNNKGDRSVGIGTYTGGLSTSTYGLNTLIGYQAGYALTAGSQNTFLGAYAGDTATTGGSNIVIGYNADVPSASASSTLNIGDAISGSMLSGGSLTFIGGIKANGVVTATYFEGDGSRLTNVGGSSDRITSNTAYVVAQSGGSILTSGSFYINNAQGGNDAALRIGANPTASHYAYIDMAGDTTYTGYGLRIIRYNTGANAASQIFHRGTGDFALVTQEAAPITFSTTNTERMRILPAGYVGISTTTPAYPLTVNGEITSLVAGGSGGQFRMIGGNYGAFWRNDGANLYLLLTDSGNANGAWNSLRPFMINLPSGAVTIGTPSPSTGMALTVAGTVSATAFKGDGSLLTNVPGVDNQIFTASGTWTKPSFATANTLVDVQCWGGGGGGTSNQGGGGGSYNNFHVKASNLPSTVAVTVGAGGAAGSNVGGSSSFGTYVTAYGGGGGDSTNVTGGGGGGIAGAGGSTNGTAGAGLGGDGTGGAGGRTAIGGSAMFGGGGGGGSASGGGAGGSSKYGGGGGGANGKAAGTSVDGGDGGAPGAAGNIPGGGAGSGAAGGRGECWVTTYGS